MRQPHFAEMNVIFFELILKLFGQLAVAHEIINVSKCKGHEWCFLSNLEIN